MPCLYIFYLCIYLFLSPTGVEDVDSSQVITTHLVSAAAAAPPAPPPKNAARMLILALPESTQPLSVQPQLSGIRTPQSPLPSQGGIHFQESPQTLSTFLSEEGAVIRGLSPPQPNNQASTATPASSCPITSSPTLKQQPLDLPTAVIKSSDDTTCSTRTEPDSTLSDPSQCPGSPSLLSTVKTEPQQQQCFTGQIPVQSNLSSNTPASNPSGSCRDGDVLSKPEVRLISFIS